MNIVLPENVKYIISILEKNGHEAYAVGGCVRDCVLGIEPADWDVTTSATPYQVKDLFEKTFDTGIEHGTVTVLLGKEGYEVTTYRIDGKYEDGRHPKEVTFTASLEEDLKRRDFTINAMAYNDSKGLVDLFGGIDDIDMKIIRAVGDPRERFTEDSLRMLRALRFAAKLGFAVEQNTYDAICELSSTLERVSAERIQVELVKLITSDNPGVIRQVYETGLSKVFLPELDDMMVTVQNCKHHVYTVGEHSVRAMEQIKPDRILRLTMLLHDVAKPICRFTDDKGEDHFYGHPDMGADMSKVILRRLKFDNDTIDAVYRLIKYHDERPEATKKAVRRFMVKAGIESFPDMFDVKYADAFAQSDYKREQKFETIGDYRRLYGEILEANNCLRVKDLAINGKDVMDLGVKQGSTVGYILKSLFEEVVDHPKLNNREYLLRRAVTIIEANKGSVE